jgi:hypothetical protein
MADWCKPDQCCTLEADGRCTDYGGCRLTGNGFRCVKVGDSCQCLYDYYEDGCAIAQQMETADNPMPCIQYLPCRRCEKYYDWLGYPYCWCNSGNPFG